MTMALDFPIRRPTVPPSVQRLLTEAEQGLAAAEQETEPAHRFATAYLSALRAAAAMLAMRGRPHRGRARPTSVWTLLASVAPEFREWAAFFAASSATRASVQAGITRVVSQRTADDLVRQVGQFVDLVRRAIRGASR
ncbi:MAG TPA: SAV_6107 family HEPN domain-containing protein [Actinophytocola sp.]|uniref:SAV_6107 family HEPN domain-containing protein n=1 Tax=Actinophytocola sp. TaxID=1872138 RepID=UPI002DDD431D|nr:SAV_6107 family HEPN domain-containing protein [Actinophytocola sp.]HEV2782969.1 SAV_6107 family HEPN domain-containing protein [Actinophytocola sp.]